MRAQVLTPYRLNDYLENCLEKCLDAADGLVYWFVMVKRKPKLGRRVRVTVTDETKKRSKTDTYYGLTIAQARAKIEKALSRE